MRKILITVLMSATMMAPAIVASAAEYQYTPKSEQKLTREPGGLYSTSQLAQHSNAMASITMRDHSGQAESHADWEDHMFIQEGEATLTLGGTMQNPHETAKGETRGSGITGGKTVTLHPGDYVFVPVNTPHRMVLAPGKSIRYAVVKTHP
jgi:mannose-6-phosphate isomerase-like protein (cupin superfamily)